MNSPTPEAVQDPWEADLEVEATGMPDPGASAEAQLARVMQGAAIPIIDRPVDETWIWSDPHPADRSILMSQDRPFHDVGRHAFEPQPEHATLP